MADAWGGSWGVSWGVSWGASGQVETPVQTGGWAWPVRRRVTRRDLGETESERARMLLTLRRVYRDITGEPDPGLDVHELVAEIVEQAVTAETIALLSGVLQTAQKRRRRDALALLLMAAS
jgi:hypothetical protein